MKFKGEVASDPYTHIGLYRSEVISVCDTEWLASCDSNDRGLRDNLALAYYTCM